MKTILDDLALQVSVFGSVVLRKPQIDELATLLRRDCERCQSLSEDVERLQVELARMRAIQRKEPSCES